MNPASSHDRTGLRILFVNRMAATERGGGETFDLEISRHLAKLGCRVTFLSNIPVFGRAKLPVPNGVLLRSPMFPWFPWDRVKGGWRVRVWEFKKFEEKAARWIMKHADEYDVIQICELPYLVYLLKSRIPHPVSRIPWIVMRLTAPNAHDPWGGITLADALIASGTSIAKIKKHVRADVHDVSNGVDLDRFRDAGCGIRDTGSGMRDQVSFREKYGIPLDAPILLYVARFQAFKNHRLLLDTFAIVRREFPAARLVLAGSGPLRQETENLARKLDVHDHLIFLGEVPFDQLPQVYAAADIKVIASEYESFCFAAIEAMASGLPVVTTDCGWVPGLIGDDLPPIDKQWVQGDDPADRFASNEPGKRIRSVGGGLVAGRTEPESLAQAVLRMLTDRELRSRCGAWNRQRAEERHGWESSARKLLEVYHSLWNDDIHSSTILH